MRGDLRCVDGRIFEHRPGHDDPDYEVDVGECPDCSGGGCGDGPGEAVSKWGRSREWLRPWHAPDRTEE